MKHAFATAECTVLPLSAASVLYDGTVSEPRLAHPEGVAVGPDGFIWCGTERGEIMRIAPDGSAMERVASTEGFALGLAFDGDRRLFVCDLAHGAVFALELATRRLSRFAGGMRIPNYPAVDAARGRLFVSDSFAPDEAGPGIFAFDLETGEGGLWDDRARNFANGIALSPAGDALFVCETFARQVSRITIEADGSAGETRPFVTDVPGLPDGIAFDEAGNLVIACYEPSRLVRVAPDGTMAVLIEDPTAHLFCHPTNVAFAHNTLYSANLGRWHITKVAMDVGAPPLWQAI